MLFVTLAIFVGLIVVATIIGQIASNLSGKRWVGVLAAIRFLVFVDLVLNTVDTLADGVTLSTREATNAARIRQQLQTLFPGQRQHFLTVPKPKVR